jgi:hypothetical protein
MNDDKQLTIHFNNGTTMEVSFPAQIKNSTAAVLESMKKVLETDKLALEADGRLVVIPWSSVKFLEMTPVPAALPFGAIKGAKIVQVASAPRS